MGGVEPTSNDFMQAVLSKAIKTQGQTLMRLLEVVQKAEVNSVRPLGNIGETPQIDLKA